MGSGEQHPNFPLWLPVALGGGGGGGVGRWEVGCTPPANQTSNDFLLPEPSSHLEAISSHLEMTRGGEADGGPPAEDRL